MRKFVGLCALVAIFAGFAGAASVYLHAPEGTIAPGVHIAGIDVGGLTMDDAAAHAADTIRARLGNPVVIFAGDASWEEIPAELGASVDVEAPARIAAAIGFGGPWLERMTERWTALSRGVNIPARVDLDPRLAEGWLDAVASRVERAPQDASLVVSEDGTVDIIPSQPGRRLDRAAVIDRMARAAIDSGSRGMRLVMQSVEPARSTADIRAAGVTTLLGAFATQFDPGDVNRTANIRIAAQALDGLLLKPGDSFSFNRTVGPRIEAVGFKEAPVLIDGELVPDIGGGVCQVSTTLYNAVLLAGLQVRSRIAHSIPSAYVPLGRDATVAYDYIDFQFENDTGSHVLLKSWIEHNQVMVAFYGPDGSRMGDHVRLETEVTEIVEPKVTVVSREDVRAGEERVVQQGRQGYRVDVWRIVENPGQSPTKEVVSRSYYQPRDRIVWVGMQADAR